MAQEAIPMGSTPGYTAPSNETLVDAGLADPAVLAQIQGDPEAMEEARRAAANIQEALKPQSTQPDPATSAPAEVTLGNGDTGPEASERQAAYDRTVQELWDGGELDGVHAKAEAAGQGAVDELRAAAQEDIAQRRQQDAEKADRAERADAFDLSRAKDEWQDTVSVLDATLEAAKRTGDWSEFDDYHGRLRQAERGVYAEHRNAVEAKEEAAGAEVPDGVTSPEVPPPPTAEPEPTQGTPDHPWKDESPENQSPESGSATGIDWSNLRPVAPDTETGQDLPRRESPFGPPPPDPTDTQVLTFPPLGWEDPLKRRAQPEAPEQDPPADLRAKAEQAKNNALSEFLGGMFVDIGKDTAQMFRLNRGIGWKTVTKLILAAAPGAALRITLDAFTGASTASAGAGAVMSVALGKHHYDKYAEGSAARRAGRFGGLVLRGAGLGYLGYEVAGMFDGGTVNAEGLDANPDSAPEAPEVQQPPFEGFTTGEIGSWDGKFDADTNYYNGTGYNATAHAMMGAYNDTTGNALNWQDLRAEPGFEGAYHDFVGRVLEANNLTWEDSRAMQDSATLHIPPEAIKEFGDSLSEITDGKVDANDFGWTESTAEAPQASVTPDALVEQTSAEAHEYVASLDSETRSQLFTEATSGNLDDAATQELGKDYLNWLSSNHPQEFGLYQAMSTAQQIEYLKLIQEALISDLTTV